MVTAAAVRARGKPERRRVGEEDTPQPYHPALPATGAQTGGASPVPYTNRVIFTLSFTRSTPWSLPWPPTPPPRMCWCLPSPLRR